MILKSIAQLTHSRLDRDRSSPSPTGSFLPVRVTVATALLVVLLQGCVQTSPPTPPVEESVQSEQSSPTTPMGSDGITAPLLEGIGPLHFQITTDIPKAQAYFNQALTLAFGFNHAEAVRSFKEAARQDPTCGICWAGAALALGPNINAPMGEQAITPAWQASRRALSLREHESPREQAYIDAIATRYSEQGKDRKTLDLIYAGSIAGVAEQFPDDLTARTLHAEALMDLMPWEYWLDDGSPANEHTNMLVSELEYVMQQDPKHPGALHLYIHTMERFEPAKAEAAADGLGDLVPVAGHLVHMPSHIYLRLGRYADAVDANARASESDEDYIAQCNAQGLYPAAYYPHNIHFLWYSAMMEGRRELSVSSALKLAERVPMAMAEQMAALQSYVAVPVYTYVRFGMWQEVLDLEKPSANIPYARAMYHYGRGLAFAATNKLSEAEAELATLVELGNTDELKNMVMRRPAVTQDLLGIAQSLVRARIQRSQGNMDKELAALKQAVKHQDTLPYTEPPLWHYPVRQTLGEAQMRNGDFAGALVTFNEDLHHFPVNPWSLYGVELAHQGLGRDTNDAKLARQKAWRNADIEPIVNL